MVRARANTIIIFTSDNGGLATAEGSLAQSIDNTNIAAQRWVQVAARRERNG